MQLYYFKYPKHVPFNMLQAASALGIIAILLVLQAYINHVSSGFNYAFSWDIVGGRTFISYFLWFLSIPIISFIYRDVVSSSTNKIMWYIHIIISLLLIASFHRFLSIWLFDMSYSIINNIPITFKIREHSMLWAGIFSSSFQVLVISGVILSIKQYKKLLRKQKALAQAELRALKMQLHPHFLFNTFHSIAALIDIDTEAAQLMLSRLSILLRSLLEKEQIQKLSLKDEISFIRHYLGIEQVRFQDRLKVIYEINPDTLHIGVPTFILQPIVENALKHGISQLTHNGIIKIKAEKLGRHTLKLMVEDNGPGVKSSNKGFGVGTENVKQRLTQLYGENNYSYEAKSLAKKGFRVTLLIPIEIIKEEYYVDPNPNH